MKKDGSKSENNGKEQPEGRLVRLYRRLLVWHIHQHLARGMAYGAGSGVVSLFLLWARSRY
ncbi:hypothetical protein DMH18_25565 [Streptomyces sp. WAC 06783]|uniref:hypothetical protein n=1 Tax=Streptomyces sp. WAC 06783 TaxID=2203211 RepID=UPI000F74B9B2|nr:hypothetical protein [Streptomyces sp. WAC 06783]RSO07308.1 hypothetical protein DMH18_25565 [Streptomyces sp. WAC 06783]